KWAAIGLARLVRRGRLGLTRGCPLADILRRGRSVQPVYLPAIFQNDDRPRPRRNPRLMHDPRWQIKVPALSDVESLTGVVVLEKVRPTKDDVRFAFLVRVLWGVEGGGEVNNQGGRVRSGLNTENGVERRVLTQVRKHHLPLLVGLVPQDGYVIAIHVV